MVKKSVRETIYFVLIFLIFFLAIKLAHFWVSKTGINSDIAYILVGIVFTLVTVALFFLAKLQTKEGFWDVSDPAKCKGGAYFWQGDSETSRMCRALAKTPAGKIAMSGYNCPTGYSGQPGLPFFYSPLSNDHWQNERCDDEPECPLVDTGMCSMQKQIP